MVLPDIVRDLALLVTRIGMGVVLVAHGWQKLATDGFDGTTRSFEQMGIPLPSLSAYFVTFVEVLGGAALILGLTVTVVGILVALEMAGAFVFVHLDNGVFVEDGGFELVLVIGVTALLLAALGSGRIGLDHLFGERVRRRRRAAAKA